MARRPAYLSGSTKRRMISSLRLEELSKKNEPPPIISNQNDPLLQNLTLSPEQTESVKQLFNAERANAYLWEYRFLNYFLAHMTQRVLDWFKQYNAKITLALFDTYWLPIIPDTEERNSIITALQAHHLIEINGKSVEITPKGREYLEWRGALSPLPKA